MKEARREGSTAMGDCAWSQRSGQLEANLVEHAEAHEHGESQTDGDCDIVHTGGKTVAGGWYGTVGVERCHDFFCPSGWLVQFFLERKEKPTYRALRWIRGLQNLERLRLLFFA